jgi:hypothetical protein
LTTSDHSTAVYCTSCGTAIAAAARFCGSCGARQEEAEPPPTAPPVAEPPPVPEPVAEPATVAASAPPPAGPPPAAPAAPAAARPTWQQSLPAPFNAIPVEVVAICALMALAGGFTLWPTARILPDIVDLLGAGDGFRELGLLLLTVWVVLALFGAGLLLLAWRLAHADRVARGLTYVLCGGLGGAILVGDDQSTELILVMLACFAAVTILLLAPNVQAFFAGQGAPQGEQPVPVVIARTLLVVWAICATLVGAMFLPLGGLGQRFVVVGVILIVLGLAAFYLSGRLAAGEPQARLIVTAGVVIYAVLLLVVERRDPGLLLPLALAGGIGWNLWMPPEARSHFGAPPQAPAG